MAQDIDYATDGVGLKRAIAYTERFINEQIRLEIEEEKRITSKPHSIRWRGFCAPLGDYSRWHWTLDGKRTACGVIIPQIHPVLTHEIDPRPKRTKNCRRCYK